LCGFCSKYAIYKRGRGPRNTTWRVNCNFKVLRNVVFVNSDLLYLKQNVGTFMIYLLSNIRMNAPSFALVTASEASS